MDEPIHQPHDKFIKKALSDPADAASFFQQRIPPEIAAVIDWNELRLEVGTFIDSRFRDFETDMLFSAPSSITVRGV